VDGTGRRSRSSAGSSARKCPPGEATLAEATLAEVRVPRPKGRPRQKPERVIADRGYDSDPLRERFKKRGIDLIVPYRKNNKARRYEDGRKLRRYKRRWIVERTNAWLGQFRRLLVRHEHLLSTYQAFFYIACFWITLRHCLESRDVARWFRSRLSVSGPFVCRCLISCSLLRFHIPLVEPGHADFPHPAHGGNFTTSPTKSWLSAVRAGSGQVAGRYSDPENGGSLASALGVFCTATDEAFGGHVVQ